MDSLQNTVDRLSRELKEARFELDSERMRELIVRPNGWSELADKVRLYGVSPDVRKIREPIIEALGAARDAIELVYVDPRLNRSQRAAAVEERLPKLLDDVHASTEKLRELGKHVQAARASMPSLATRASTLTRNGAEVVDIEEVGALFGIGSQPAPRSMDDSLLIADARRELLLLSGSQRAALAARWASSGDHRLVAALLEAPGELGLCDDETRAQAIEVAVRRRYPGLANVLVLAQQDLQASWTGVATAVRTLTDGSRAVGLSEQIGAAVGRFEGLVEKQRQAVDQGWEGGSRPIKEHADGSSSS